MTISDIPTDELEDYINSGGIVKNPISTKADQILVENQGGVLQHTIPKVESDEVQSNQTPLLPPTRATGFAFTDPVDLLFFLDDSVRDGIITLHDWQIQFMLDFAKGGCDHEHPFHALVRAANGSGKDKYIIAACAVWLNMAYIRASSVVTSSSGQQLDTQTCRHITFLCEAANRKIAPDIWKINYRHYTCLATGSPIDCFATDEPGKAEGFHPLDYGCKMALFMSEAKTVTDDINSAYDRCDGYTHRVHVSSPGVASGHFYDDCLNSIPRHTIKTVCDTSPANWIHYLITAYDCSHISKVRISKLIDKYGIDDPLVQSSIFAEFSTQGEKVIIPYHFVNPCIENSDIKWEQEAFNTAGLDLADGGDETVLIVRNGNKIINICPFQLDNSDDTYFHVRDLLMENKLNNPESIIFADCGGIGKPTLDRLRRNGWLNIKYIDNRSAAHDKRAFYKCATEYWWHLRMLCQRKQIIIPRDKKLKEQLSGRYYKLRDGVLRHLLSKQEQKAKGYKSPDRADGTVLCFLNYKATWKETAPTDKERPYIPATQPKPPSEFILASWAKEDIKSPWDRNPSRNKDFSLLREDIAIMNQQHKENNDSTRILQVAGNNEPELSTSLYE